MELKLSFGHPLHGTIELLDSALDCYSGNPKGYWNVKPKLEAPLSHYKACRDVLEKVQRTQSDISSVGEYLLSILNTANNEAGSNLEIVLLAKEK
jgi:hypothetical protein